MLTRIGQPLRAILGFPAIRGLPEILGLTALAFLTTSAPGDDSPQPTEPPKASSALAANVEEPAAAAGPAARAIVVDADLEFACPAGEPLHLDVYRPAPVSGQPTRHPAVLLVHGGGWASGDKWTTAGYARAFAEAGMVAVTVNYRLAPTHKFPAQVDDIRAALAWLGAHADEYDVDLTRVGMFGYSAGAHLVCMIGTLSDAEWSDIEPTTAWEPQDPRWQTIPPVCAIVGGGAPCEFRNLPVDNTAISYFLGGPRRDLPEVYRAASPAAHASPGDVPVLFVHGTRDLIVPHASSRVLFDAQIAAGVASEYLAIDGSGHMLTYLNPATRRAAIEFLAARLGLAP